MCVLLVALVFSSFSTGCSLLMLFWHLEFSLTTMLSFFRLKFEYRQVKLFNLSIFALTLKTRSAVSQQGMFFRMTF
jgi:hypothetical protein